MLRSTILALLVAYEIFYWTDLVFTKKTKIYNLIIASLTMGVIVAMVVK